MVVAPEGNERRSSTRGEAELMEEPVEEPEEEPEEELEEELEEVSEETLNWFNLSVDERVHHRTRSSSEEEQEEQGGSCRHRVTSEEAKASWRETLQQHFLLEDQEDQEDQEDESDDEEEFGGSELESSDGEDFSLFVPSAAGSDITPCDSISSPTAETPLTASTPSTASFNTDSEAPPTLLTPVVVKETQRGLGLLGDVVLEKPLPLQGRGVGPDEEGVGSERRRTAGGVHSLPPCLQLKTLREALPPGQVDGDGARTLWRTVFSGNRKQQKKKKKMRGGTLPPANQSTAADVTEESDLDSTALLQRCSLTPANNRRSRKDRVPLQDSDGRSSCATEVVGVLVQAKEPSSLSVMETMFQRGQEDEDEDLDAKITRRVQRAARRKAKQEQLKRLHKAQMIQRQLQQVEERQRQLEETGVVVEKALRGEADFWGESSNGLDVELHLEGLGKLDNPALMQQWFQLVQQKNSLIRYESELMIFARELELEDRQSRLQQELRERMAVDDHLKEEQQLLEERLILEEMLEVVEQRNSLVSLLEEQRLQERQEDRDLEQVMMTRGLELNWT